MALGPQPQKTAARLKQAEKIIDAAIRKSNNSARVTIACELLPIEAGEWHVLAAKYKSAGWRSALWTSDQRDGDFIDLVGF